MELGSTVHLTYTGTLEDGTVFGVAKADSPMVFQTGMDMAIPGFEKEILEMNEAGEKKTFTVGQYDAYGEYRDEWTQEIPLDSIPVQNLTKGKRVWMYDGDGGPIPLTVLSVGETTAVFDMNHPLAGHDLTFEVEILEIEDAPEDFVSAAEKERRMKKLAGQNEGTADSFGTELF